MDTVVANKIKGTHWSVGLWDRTRPYLVEEANVCPNGVMEAVACVFYWLWQNPPSVW